MDWRKIVFAAVVSRLASTKRVRQPAYATRAEFSQLGLRVEAPLRQERQHLIVSDRAAGIEHVVAH